MTWYQDVQSQFGQHIHTYSSCMQSPFLCSCCFLPLVFCFHFDSLCLPDQLFLTFPLHASSFSPLFPNEHLSWCMVQCALLTPTLQSQCPSPTSAHTNLSASTPDPASALPTLSLTLTLRKKMDMGQMGRQSRAADPWPSPTNRPLSLNLQVTLHGGSNLDWG